MYCPIFYSKCSLQRLNIPHGMLVATTNTYFPQRIFHLKRNVILRFVKQSLVCSKRKVVDVQKRYKAQTFQDYTPYKFPKHILYESDRNQQTSDRTELVENIGGAFYKLLKVISYFVERIL